MLLNQASQLSSLAYNQLNDLFHNDEVRQAMLQLMSEADNGKSIIGDFPFQIEPSNPLVIGGYIVIKGNNTIAIGKNKEIVLGIACFHYFKDKLAISSFENFQALLDFETQVLQYIKDHRFGTLRNIRGEFEAFVVVYANNIFGKDYGDLATSEDKRLLRAFLIGLPLMSFSAQEIIGILVGLESQLNEKGLIYKPFTEFVTNNLVQFDDLYKILENVDEIYFTVSSLTGLYQKDKTKAFQLAIDLLKSRKKISASVEFFANFNRENKDQLFESYNVLNGYSIPLESMPHILRYYCSVIDSEFSTDEMRMFSWDFLETNISTSEEYRLNILHDLFYIRGHQERKIEFLKKHYAPVQSESEFNRLEWWFVDFKKDKKHLLFDYFETWVKNGGNSKLLAKLIKRVLYNDIDLIAKYITQWFIIDHPGLNKFAGYLTNKYNGIEEEISIFLNEDIISSSSDEDLLYLIHKVVGTISSGFALSNYLFSTIKSDNTSKQLRDVVISMSIEYVLYNYRSSRQYYVLMRKNGAKNQKKAASEVLKWFDSYSKDLKKAEFLRELAPSAKRMESYRRRMNQIFQSQVKHERENDSIFQMVTQVALKSGGGWFSRVDDRYTPVQHLQTIESSGEIPMGETIDPLWQTLFRTHCLKYKRK